MIQHLKDLLTLSPSWMIEILWQVAFIHKLQGMSFGSIGFNARECIGHGLNETWAWWPSPPVRERSLTDLPESENGSVPPARISQCWPDEAEFIASRDCSLVLPPEAIVNELGNFADICLKMVNYRHRIQVNAEWIDSFHARAQLPIRSSYFVFSFRHSSPLMGKEAL